MINEAVNLNLATNISLLTHPSMSSSFSCLSMSALFPLFLGRSTSWLQSADDAVASSSNLSCFFIDESAIK